MYNGVESVKGWGCRPPRSFALATEFTYLGRRPGGVRRIPMGWRLFRRIRIAPGIRINLSRSGPSLSVGPRGFQKTIGRKGVRTTVGRPGTGIFHTDVEPGIRRPAASDPGALPAVTRSPSRRTSDRTAGPRCLEVPRRGRRAALSHADRRPNLTRKWRSRISSMASSSYRPGLDRNQLSVLQSLRTSIGRRPERRLS